MKVRLINSPVDFSGILKKINTVLNFSNNYFDDVTGILCLIFKKNYEGSRPFQINRDDIKDFFPVVIRSDYSEFWQYNLDIKINNVDGQITLLPILTSSNYEYIQIKMSDKGAAAALKKTLVKNDRILFVKKENSAAYDVLCIREKENPFVVGAVDGAEFLAIKIDPTRPNKPNFSLPALRVSVNNEKHPLNQILFGAPGTGKTFNSINHALSIITGEDLKELIETQKKSPANRILAKGKFDALMKIGQIQFVTFHQSYSYEEFVEGIRPIVKDKEVEYKIVPGIFKRLCKTARENDSVNFVLIIDEINRGNISKIFGELITLIEDSKRIGNDEELRIKLTYSSTTEDEVAEGDQMFGVPKNIFIIGTMNTADKSIALVDLALRRRFTFIEYCADPELLQTTSDGIDLKEMLKIINKRIELLLDKDHFVGHAYFMEKNNKKDIFEVFKNKIIPLLQEYFHNDFKNVAWVLGDHDDWKGIDKNIEDNLSIRLIRLRKNLNLKKIFGFSDKDEFDEKKNEIYYINSNLAKSEFTQPIEALTYIYKTPAEQEAKAEEVKAEEVKAEEVKAEEVKAEEVKLHPILSTVS